MADSERLTITLPSSLAAAVKGAVEGGDYASGSDVVREALQDWAMKRALKHDIEQGMADVAAGRVKDFEVGRIIERGKKRFAGRYPSA